MERKGVVKEKGRKKEKLSRGKRKWKERGSVKKKGEKL